MGTSADEIVGGLLNVIPGGGLLGAGLKVANQIFDPRKKKLSYYKDPYVREMERTNTQALQQNQMLSPMGAKKAASGSLQTGAANAGAGAGNIATSQQMGVMAGSGDADTGMAGARAISGILGARSGYDNALSTLETDAYKNEADKANSRSAMSGTGAEIGDKFIQNSEDKGTDWVGLGAAGLTQGKNAVEQLMGVGRKKLGVGEEEVAQGTEGAEERTDDKGNKYWVLKKVTG